MVLTGTVILVIILSKGGETHPRVSCDLVKQRYELAKILEGYGRLDAVVTIWEIFALFQQR